MPNFYDDEPDYFFCGCLWIEILGYFLRKSRNNSLFSGKTVLREGWGTCWDWKVGGVEEVCGLRAPLLHAWRSMCYRCTDRMCSPPRGRCDASFTAEVDGREFWPVV